jgi:hypothetical protein
MLTEFIIRNDLDILLLQEVVTEDLYPIYGYTIHINIETERRGTAIVIRDSMHLEDRKITEWKRNCWETTADYDNKFICTLG